MKIKFTKQSLISLKESLDFISKEVSFEKLKRIRDEVLDSTDILITHPKLGKKEEYLTHLKLGHRSIIEGNYKIIYKIEKEVIYITDIFDTRQNPEKMKG
ncbi:MAG: type II toxin-antitoxin system RelE/ParE family toxin [Flavobacteriales bacterium]|nr:type II toxin-antitoxin system RelE/ParE family toxin [Flavobacteriales bacterium]MCB9364776.1 type II toxin-antitoxin system RelE/ParE family toxin [Flavobacteriales bacterium]